MDGHTLGVNVVYSAAAAAFMFRVMVNNSRSVITTFVERIFTYLSPYCAPYVMTHAVCKVITLLNVIAYIHTFQH